MAPGLATALRLAGPLIEAACIGLLFRVRGRGYRALGLAAETWLYAGVGLGAVLVVAGLALSRRPRPPADRWDLPRGRT